MLDPDALTLGFARRFAEYKRPNLLLHDPARLIRLLTRAERPVQIIIAGKAHPQDEDRQALDQSVGGFCSRSRPCATGLCIWKTTTCSCPKSWYAA